MKKHNSVIKNYVNFVLKPEYQELNSINVVKGLTGTFKILLITLALNVIAKLLIIVLENAIDIHRVDQTTLKETLKIVNRRSTLVLLFNIGVAAAIEELIFRFALTKYKLKLIQFSFSMMVASVFVWKIEIHTLLPNLVYLQYLLLNTVSIFGLAGIFFLLIKKLLVVDFSDSWNKSFPFVFYTVTFIFAFVHLPLRNMSVLQWFFSPIILLPFIIMGISFGYVRVKYGFAYATLLHSAINIISLIPVLLK